MKNIILFLGIFFSISTFSQQIIKNVDAATFKKLIDEKKPEEDNHQD